MERVRGEGGEGSGGKQGGREGETEGERQKEGGREREPGKENDSGHCLEQRDYTAQVQRARYSNCPSVTRQCSGWPWDLSVPDIMTVELHPGLESTRH